MTTWLGKTVVVAGGAGFIGHHLVGSLLKDGAEVHVIDNLSTGLHANLGNMTTLYGEKLTIDIQDVCYPNELPTCDVIFNLASPASPLHYQADPFATWKSNILGTLHLLENAQRLGATMVQASTSEIYGDPISHPQTETDWGNVNPIGPRACYDESKRAAESLLMDAARVADADVRIARLFNTYGTGMTQNDGRAIPNFIAQAKAGKPLTIFGQGTQTRSFCYVSDTVNGLLCLAITPAARGEVVNIGNPNEITILTIAEKINALWENAAGIAFKTAAIDDPMRRRPDISKAKRILGWTPEVTLEAGLKEMKRTNEPV